MLGEILKRGKKEPWSQQRVRQCFVISVLGVILESSKWKHLEVLGVTKRRKVRQRKHVYIKIKFQKIIISSFVTVNIMART